VFVILFRVSLVFWTVVWAVSELRLIVEALHCGLVLWLLWIYTALGRVHELEYLVLGANFWLWGRWGTCCFLFHNLSTYLRTLLVRCLYMGRSWRAAYGVRYIWSCCSNGHWVCSSAAPGIATWMADLQRGGVTERDSEQV
jgi:hypothetical protein